MSTYRFTVEVAVSDGLHVSRREVERAFRAMLESAREERERLSEQMAEGIADWDEDAVVMARSEISISEATEVFES